MIPNQEGTIARCDGTALCSVCQAELKALSAEKVAEFFKTNSKQFCNNLFGCYLSRQKKQNGRMDYREELERIRQVDHNPALIARGSVSWKSLRRFERNESRLIAVLDNHNVSLKAALGFYTDSGEIARRALEWTPETVDNRAADKKVPP